MKNDNEERDSLKRQLISMLFISLLGLGLVGALLGYERSHNPQSGFFWGIGIGLALSIVSLVGILGWEWIKKEANKGKMLPYLLVGLVVAIAASAFIALSLGKPSCDEQGDAPYSSCISYANNGFEATSSQMWKKFWITLPITLIISTISAIIVRNALHKKR